ncbi:MAG: hypothetical protein NTX63_03525 [Candidatus Peregrinibacteria bacterium]|nr:hypothetical protein [Candidatus Peregrinibacteria bacterium]
MIFSLVLILSIPAKYEDIMAVGLDKFSILKTSKHPLMVFVGGSSVMYGIDPGILSENLPYHVVSLGYYVGTGLDFYFETLPQYLQKGDVVVLMPEYGLFSEKKLPDRKAGKWLFYEDPYVYAKLVAMKDPVLFAKSALTALQERVKMLIMNGIADKSGYRGYTAHFDHSGALNFESFPPPIPLREHEDVAKEYGFPDSGEVARSIDRMNAFYKEMSAKGVDVVLTYQPFPYTEFARSSRLIDTIHQQIKTLLKVPVLGEPSDFVLSIRYFFDTANHLGHEGRTFRTDMINNFLVDYLKKGKKVDLPAIERTDPLQEITDGVINPRKISYIGYFFGELTWTDGHGYLGWFSLKLHDQRYLKLNTYGGSPYFRDPAKLDLRLSANETPLEYVCRVDASFYFKLPLGMKEIQNVRINSNTFVPKDFGMNNDTRSLGIDVDTLEPVMGVDMNRCDK